MAIKDAGHGVLNYHGKIFACLLRKKIWIMESVPKGICYVWR